MKRSLTNILTLMAKAAVIAFAIIALPIVVIGDMSPTVARLFAAVVSIVAAVIVAVLATATPDRVCHRAIRIVQIAASISAFFALAGKYSSRVWADGDIVFDAAIIVAIIAVSVVIIISATIKVILKILDNGGGHIAFAFVFIVGIGLVAIVGNIFDASRAGIIASFAASFVTTIATIIAFVTGIVFAFINKRANPWEHCGILSTLFFFASVVCAVFAAALIYFV